MGFPRLQFKKPLNGRVWCHTACHEVLLAGPAVCCRSWRRRARCSTSRWQRSAAALTGPSTRLEIETAGSLWLWRVWECRPIRTAFLCPRCERWRCSNDSSSSTIPTSSGTETHTLTHVLCTNFNRNLIQTFFYTFGFCIMFYYGFSHVNFLKQWIQSGCHFISYQVLLLPQTSTVWYIIPLSHWTLSSGGLCSALHINKDLKHWKWDSLEKRVFSLLILTSTDLSAVTDKSTNYVTCLLCLESSTLQCIRERKEWKGLYGPCNDDNCKIKYEAEG